MNMNARGNFALQIAASNHCR